MSEPRRVCLTGAAGYIGTAVFEALLARGHQVRATVRDASDEGKLAPLRRLAAGAAHPPQYFSADLSRPGAFDEAVAGCDAVIHVATSVRLAAKDPQRTILDPALHGTRNVLQAVRLAPSVTTLIQTSSIAAIIDPKKPDEHTFSEEDWAKNVGLNDEPYALAKMQAERMCHDFARALGDQGRPLRFIAINPSVVLGPIHHRHHARSSPAFVANLLKNSYPANPRLYLNLVDVRDVARAHVAALESDGCAGRYIVHNRGLWMTELAAAVKALYPERKIPTRQMPDLGMYAAALFDKRISFGLLRNSLGRVRRLDNRRSRQELVLAYRPLEETIRDTCTSLLEVGRIERRRR